MNKENTNMKQMLFEFPNSVIKDIKQRALDNNTTSKQIVLDALVKTGITTKKNSESD
jgi:hypothetical protein